MTVPPRHGPDATPASSASPEEGAGSSPAHGTGSTSSTRRHTLVRPRLVWSGLALALLGVVVAGVGLMSSAWLLVGGAVLVLVIGACLSWAGGAMHDATTGLDLHDELRAVRDGTTHPGVRAGAQTGSTAAHEEAARQTRVTQQVLDQARHTSASDWTKPAGWTLLLVAAVLLVSQWELVAHSATGRSNSYLDTAVAIVLALVGLRQALTPGPHRITAALAGLSGLGLTLNGVLATHDHASLAVVETAGGLVALLCAAAATLSTRTRTRPGG